jgi:hypothetical protein
MAVLLLLAGCGVQGRTYDKTADVVAAQEKKGYLLLGTFDGGAWPATVTEEKTVRDSLTFTRKDGQTHIYSDYKGHTLKLLRLEAANGKETVVVLRSK